MPPLTFSCTTCSKLMGVPAELAGRAVRCPHCQAVVVAPAIPTPAVPPVPVVPPPPPPIEVTAPPPPPPIQAESPLPNTTPSDMEDMPAAIRDFQFAAPPTEGAESIFSDPEEDDDSLFASPKDAGLGEFRREEHDPETLPNPAPPPTAPREPAFVSPSVPPVSPVVPSAPETPTFIPTPPYPVPVNPFSPPPPVPNNNPFDGFAEESPAPSPVAPWNNSAPTPIPVPAAPPPAAPWNNPAPAPVPVVSPSAAPWSNPAPVPMPVPIPVPVPVQAVAVPVAPTGGPVASVAAVRPVDDDLEMAATSRSKRPARTAKSGGLPLQMIAIILLLGYSFLMTVLAFWGWFIHTPSPSKLDPAPIRSKR